MSDVTAAEKKCPECGEMVPGDVSLCRHCGFVFVAAKGEALPAPIAANSSSKTLNQTGVWDAAKMLFPRRVAGIVAVAVVVFLSLAFWLVRLNQSGNNDSSDNGFAGGIGAVLPGSPQVKAANGYCQIVMVADAAAQQINPQAIAQNVARRYSQWRAKYGKGEHVRVEVFFGDTKTAEATQ